MADPSVDRTQQQEVADRVNQGLQQVSELRSHINDQLSLLNERRQALITAAVTGQLDITTAHRKPIP